MQFQDAEEDLTEGFQPPFPQNPVPRPIGSYIDDDLEEVSEEEAEIQRLAIEEMESYENSSLQDGLDEVMDQDWEIISGDFTKRYNRLKQQVLVTHQTHQPKKTGSRAEPAALPAMNRPKQFNTNHTGTKITLSRLNSLISLDPLSLPTTQSSASTLHTSTRKGSTTSSARLVKDKASRATTEQVLDPRTMLILLKMFNREIIGRVEGCVSTGKEGNVYFAYSGPGFEGFSSESLQLQEEPAVEATLPSYNAPPSETTHQEAVEEQPEVKQQDSVIDAAAVEDGIRKVRFDESILKEPEPEPKSTEPSKPQTALAIKIYKTSILVFKDRDRYITGEHRFKSGYARSNPRKMVRMWAEKECRNLRRLAKGGVRTARTVEVRENVLVMEFLGDDGGEGIGWRASPRLKDAVLPEDRLDDLYVEILVILRTMFVTCRLVHADFSEYNILYHQSHLYVIDVSQSVEHDHPAAYDFLRADILNADEFFKRRGVNTLGVKETFRYVTKDATVDQPQKEMQQEAERLLARRDDDYEEETNTKENPTQDPNSESVFFSSYIPRALHDVYDAERDVYKVLDGQKNDLIYGEDLVGDATDSEGDEGHGDETDQSDLEDDSDSTDKSNNKPRGKKFEDKDEKKKRRQATKEAAREKRKTKMSKADKARRVKKSSGKR